MENKTLSVEEIEDLISRIDYAIKCQIKGIDNNDCDVLINEDRQELRAIIDYALQLEKALADNTSLVENAKSMNETNQAILKKCKKLELALQDAIEHADDFQADYYREEEKNKKLREDNKKLKYIDSERKRKINEVYCGIKNHEISDADATSRIGDLLNNITPPKDSPEVVRREG
jgi:hypothetical protein